MKLRIYTDYTQPRGTVGIADGVLQLDADEEQAESIRNLVAFYASNFQLDNGRAPTPEEVLKLMAERMPDGKRTWCEVVE